MKLLSFLTRYSRRTAVLAIMAGIISGTCNTALLALMNAALKDGNPRSGLLFWGFIGLCVLLPISRFISEALLSRLGQGALSELRLRLSRQILAAPLRHLEELGAHRLLAALTDDVPVITNALLMIPLLSINIAVIAGGLIYLGWLSLIALSAVIVFMLLGVSTYQVAVLMAGRRFRLAREDGDALLNHFRAITDGTKELKLHKSRREAFLSRVLQATSESLKRHNIDGMMIYSAASSWGQTLVFFVIGFALFIVPSMGNIGVQTLTGYALILLYLMTPFQVLMNTLPGLGRANIAIKKVEELGLSLSSQAKEADPAELPSQNHYWNRLELSGVTHAYRREGEEDSFTLGPINLSLRPGELLFLVGGNGSGKTTLAKLIVGLYMPEEGEILFDGRPITDDNRESFRQYFSVVFSDFYLFDSLLGMENPELDDLTRTYLKQFQLDHKVKVKDGVLSTTDLSQGQRKRLALLTAYLEDRPIYLFDEWAADQDPTFKEVFYYRLLPELKSRGKTVIVISHDVRYYHIADRIVKLEYGKVEYDRPASRPHSVSAEMPAI